MPNIVLTNRCNNNCSFCFSVEKKGHNDLTLLRLKEIIEFINSYHRESVNIVGGEPSLNRELFQIVKYLHNNQYAVSIFTNGMLKDDLIEKLQNIKEGELTLNINRSDNHSGREINNVYKKLGHLILLSYTVYKKNQNPLHILDDINKYNLIREYRIGIASPVWPDKKNTYLSPVEYASVSNEIFEFIKMGIKSAIRPIFDCGFPYCFFNLEQKEYFDRNHISFTSMCGIIPDILPDKIIPCFPLQNFCITDLTSNNGTETETIMEEKIENAAKNFLFKECSSCKDLAKGNCTGGCLALRLPL